MTRIVAEDLKKISIYDFRRWGLLKLGDITGYSGTLTWSRHGSAYSQIRYLLHYAKYVPVLLTLDYKSVDTETAYAPRIELVSTDNNYGGKRFWFLCPRCNKRCAKLYIYDFQPYCRVCLNLSYECNNKSKSFRTLDALLGSSKTEEYHERLISTRRYFYAGKPTKTYNRYLRRRTTYSHVIDTEKILQELLRSRGRPRKATPCE